MSFAPSIIYFAALASALALAGCTVGPNYQDPRPALPGNFSAQPSKTPAAGVAPGETVEGVEAVQRWWLTFRDPELASLVDRALHNNRDLKLAASRLRQARTERFLAAGTEFPDINAGASYFRGLGSKNVVLPLGGTSSSSGSSSGSGSGSAGSSGKSTSPHALEENTSSAGSAGTSGGSAGPPASPLGQGGLPGVTTNVYQIGFDSSWEIDLFGGVRRTIEAANAGVQVAEEAERGVTISLLGEVAATYIELRGAQARLDVTRRALDAAQEMQKLVAAKFHTGFATDLDLARQASQTATLAATVPPQVAAVRLAMHSLATMLAENPDDLRDELDAIRPLPGLPAEIPVGLPSDLLRRRPDIREAERRLAAANAEVGVATADLFPRFALTGLFGIDSSAPKDLPKWSSHYYSISPGVRWPILDWGRARGNVRLQNIYQEQAMTMYETTVAQALQEVEDALVRYHSEQEHRVALQDARDAGEHAFVLAQMQFRHGVVDSLSVLDAERTELQAEDALVQSEAAVRSDLVRLYKALGGGWSG